MLKYFFLLGRQVDISYQELKSVFPEKNFDIFKNIAIFSSEKEKLAPDLINSLGGTIKIGEIIAEFPSLKTEGLFKRIKEELREQAQIHLKKKEGKFNFAFSLHFLENKKKFKADLFKIGLNFKREGKTEGLISRLVTSKEEVLSSVVVEQNNLITKGIELSIIAFKNKIYLGKTLAVQDFKAFSKRDFGRPQRDDFSGMLPPKLAQIMINLAKKEGFENKIILDPFCGSGTVLMEAYLLGFKRIIGSDLSKKAISDTLNNIDWIIEQELIKNKEKKKGEEKNIFQIFEKDVLLLNESLEKNSLDYIVTEPYLGPARGFFDPSLLVKDLNLLYSKSLEIFYYLLKKGGRVVMIWPQFNFKGRVYSVEPRFEGFEIKIDNLVYKREGQRVWRRIVLLEK